MKLGCKGLSVLDCSVCCSLPIYCRMIVVCVKLSLYELDGPEKVAPTLLLDRLDYQVSNDGSLAPRC